MRKMNIPEVTMDSAEKGLDVQKRLNELEKSSK